MTGVKAGYFPRFCIVLTCALSLAACRYPSSSGNSGPSSGLIQFKQASAVTSPAPTAAVSVQFDSAQSAGDFNIVVVGWGDTTASVSSVTDSFGNAYSRAVG